MPDLRSQLTDMFGLDDFRRAQREVIEDVLAGHDVLCVMPTGAGKSLCYQFPAAVRPGLTIVVSPLISLMQDQVQQLSDEGIRAVFLNSTLNPGEQRDVIAQLSRGFEGLLYIAPERFVAPVFQRLLGSLKPALLAVDEAHCISTWGHDFRPDYARLGEFRQKMGAPPTIALTATATEDVRGDIVRQLQLREPRVYVTGFDRPNLRYECMKINKEREKVRTLAQLIQGEKGSGIVYCATRSAVDELVTILKEQSPSREILGYHAGMEADARSQNQERFMQTASAVAVATNAFGMGINKPDIRFVVHYNLPGRVEAYYQEAGRAGRDGQVSRCIILFSYQDTYIQQHFIDKMGSEVDESDTDRIDRLKQHAREKLQIMIQYAETHRCRRRMILDYFGDDAQIHDCDCDVCLRERGGSFANPLGTPVSMPAEVATLVRKLLSGIARVSMKGQFGVAAIAEVLGGAQNERMGRWQFANLSVYGLLRAHSIKRIVAMLHRLMESGLARQRDPEGLKFRPIVELTAAGVAVMKGEQPVPAGLADLLGRSQESEERPARSALRVDDGGAMDAAAQSRFERLRAIRAELARERQLPAYCICHDSTLRQIARIAPRSLEALEMVKGMGPNKVRMYGEAILAGFRQEGDAANSDSVR